MAVGALLACLISWAPALLPWAGGDHPPTRAEALELLERGRVEQAVKAFELLRDAQPEEAVAWFDLARAHHIAGDYGRAIAIGRRAAEFPEVRATCLYNVACAAALQGEADQAAEALDEALAAGFLDYDLLAVDTDLELLRSAGRLPMPHAHDYETLRHGGVEVPYLVMLPTDYDPEQTYPAAVVFAPGGMGKRSMDWTLDTLAGSAARAGWILVFAAQPDNGWINHPSHHALNALMTHVRKQHHVRDDRFRFVGLGAGGRPATTYSEMSRPFVSGLILVDSQAFDRWDDGEVADLADGQLPLTLVAAAGDVTMLSAARRVHDLVTGAGGQVDLVVVDGDRPALLSVDVGSLLAAVDP